MHESQIIYLGKSKMYNVHYAFEFCEQREKVIKEETYNMLGKSLFRVIMSDFQALNDALLIIHAVGFGEFIFSFIHQSEIYVNYNVIKAELVGDHFNSFIHGNYIWNYEMEYNEYNVIDYRRHKVRIEFECLRGYFQEIGKNLAYMHHANIRFLDINIDVGVDELMEIMQCQLMLK